MWVGSLSVTRTKVEVNVCVNVLYLFVCRLAKFPHFSSFKKPCSAPVYPTSVEFGSLSAALKGVHLS